MLRNQVLLCLAAMVAVGCSSGKGSGGKGASDVARSRIDIKHATDPDAASIDLTPKEITVEDLLAMKVPQDMNGGLENYPERRLGDFEKSTFRIKGTLKSVVHKKDGDYYLVMEGKSGAQAVVEVPDPKLAKGSPILDRIQAARSEIESKYHPTDTPKAIDEPAVIEGVGFYGWKGRPGSGGHGSAPRLMPGTGFTAGK